jgi:hypothetical protein
VEPFPRLVAALRRAHVQFVLIGVGGANLWARSGHAVFTTVDFDLFVPHDPANQLRIWKVCDALGLELWCGDEPLDRPRDRKIATHITRARALVRATDARGLEVDFTQVMAGYRFSTVWAARRSFLVEGVRVPVARLTQIVRSKALAGRPKDRLFLATHAEALDSLIARRRKPRTP